MFTVRRTVDAASELTVSVTVKETGTTLAGATPAAVTFGAGKSSTALVVGTDDDEAASTVNASVWAGEGYAGAAHILDRERTTTWGFLSAQTYRWQARLSPEGGRALGGS